MIAWVRLWILLSALLVGAGWILSALHQLNRLGYEIVFALALLAGWYGWQSTPGHPGLNPQRGWHKLRRRFRRAAPQLFLLLFILAGLQGVLYAPIPGDAEMYRTTRVLHWLAAGHWHWIHTFDIRMNIASCGMEWLTAPVLLFTGSDRWLFLINLFSYALLPGLAFSVFRQLGITGRVAWWWMWMVPAAFFYAFQAGTLANDSYAAIYSLAAVNLALRASRGGRPGDLWISMLAAGLFTSSKQTNLPLGLLWLLAALPALKFLRQRPLAALTVVLATLLISSLPTDLLNLLHDGNWMGVPNHPGADWAEWHQAVMRSPGWGVVGNLFSLPLQQINPPFFFCYKSWNDLMARWVQTPFGSHFSPFQLFGHLTSFPDEQSAGLGFMICLFLPVSVFWAWSWRRQHLSGRQMPGPDWQTGWLRLAPWGLLLLFMARVSSNESGRLLSPYYPFLLLAVLGMPGMPALVRQRWWQRFGLLCLILAAGLLILEPLRPLWPAGTLLGRLARQHPASTPIARLQNYYSSPEINQRARRPFQKTLPENEPVVGYATTVMGVEPGLWRPFQRRVERVRPEDSSAYLAQLGIHYVVVDEHFLGVAGLNLEQLTQRYQAQVIDQIAQPSGWQKPPSYLYLLRINAHVLSR